MRIGTVCYAISRGLGHLARDFHQHGIITDVCVMKHSSIPTQESWYPNAPQTSVHGVDRKLLYDFAAGLDAMLFFETPFDWSLLDYCREKGVKTALIAMYECTPRNIPHQPDLWICPSLLDVEYFKKYNHVYLPLPVEMPWKQRTIVQTYVHNGGYLGLRGKDGYCREGTEILIKAMQHVRTPLNLIIRVQENVGGEYQKMMAKDPRITYIPENVPFEELHRDGEVYVAPQKWNGCSLPLQEAFASGYLMMTTHRFPMTTWMPNEPMIPVDTYIKDSCIGGSYMTFQEAVVSPQSVAATMDQWYGRDVSTFSLQGRVWALENSWERLKPRYMEALTAL